MRRDLVERAMAGDHDAFSAPLEQTQIGIPEEFSWQRAPMASR
jgi:hypothetical protein